jgi:excisionase family DNA binding protein
MGPDTCHISASDRQTQKPYLTVPEAATRSGIGQVSMYQLVRENKIPNIRVGRKIIIPKAAFEKWFETAHGQLLTQ